MQQREQREKKPRSGLSRANRFLGVGFVTLFVASLLRAVTDSVVRDVSILLGLLAAGFVVAAVVTHARNQ